MSCMFCGGPDDGCSDMSTCSVIWDGQQEEIATLKTSHSLLLDVLRAAQNLLNQIQGYSTVMAEEEVAKCFERYTRALEAYAEIPPFISAEKEPQK